MTIVVQGVQGCQEGQGEVNGLRLIQGKMVAD